MEQLPTSKLVYTFLILYCLTFIMNKVIFFHQWFKGMSNYWKSALNSDEGQPFIDLSSRLGMPLHLGRILCHSYFLLFIITFLVWIEFSWTLSPWKVLLDQLFLHQSICLLFMFDCLLLLVPPPFVDLRLGQTCGSWHFSYFVFIPVWLLLKFLFQNPQLGCALSLSFLWAIITSIKIIFILIQGIRLWSRVLRFIV